jgi:hypothetical protein
MTMIIVTSERQNIQGGRGGDDPERAVAFPEGFKELAEIVDVAENG